MRLAAAVFVALAAAGPSTSPAAAPADPAAPTPAPKTERTPATPAPSPKAEGGSPRTGATVTRPTPAAASELARALLPQAQWSRVLDSYASSLAGQVSEALLSKGEKVPDDLRPRIRAELDRALPYQRTVQAQADALANELSPDELKKTAAFYRSPVGRKVLERLPEAQSAVAQQLQSQLATAVPDIVNRIAPSAMAASPSTGDGAAGRAPGAPPQSPPAQGRRPPPQTGGTR